MLKVNGANINHVIVDGVEINSLLVDGVEMLEQQQQQQWEIGEVYEEGESVVVEVDDTFAYVCYPYLTISCMWCDNYAFWHHGLFEGSPENTHTMSNNDVVVAQEVRQMGEDFFVPSVSQILSSKLPLLNCFGYIPEVWLWSCCDDNEEMATAVNLMSGNALSGMKTTALNVMPFRRILRNK